MRTLTYALPKRALPRFLDKLQEIENLDVRSAANALVHLIGRFHTGTENFGRQFFLCREQLSVHPEMQGHTEWHIRLGIAALQSLEIIRRVWSSAKPRFRVGGFRRAPTLFELHPLWANLFPAALKPRRRRALPSPECSSTFQESLLPEPVEREGVHSGEPAEEHQPTKVASEPMFEGGLKAALSKVVAHAAAKAQNRLRKPDARILAPDAQASSEPPRRPKIQPVEDLTAFDREMIRRNQDVIEASQSSPRSPEPVTTSPIEPRRPTEDVYSRILDRHGIPRLLPEPDGAS